MLMVTMRAFKNISIFDEIVMRAATLFTVEASRPLDMKEKVNTSLVVVAMLINDF